MTAWRDSAAAGYGTKFWDGTRHPKPLYNALDFSAFAVAATERLQGQSSGISSCGKLNFRQKCAKIYEGAAYRFDHPRQSLWGAMTPIRPASERWREGFNYFVGRGYTPIVRFSASPPSSRTGFGHMCCLARSFYFPIGTSHLPLKTWLRRTFLFSFLVQGQREGVDRTDGRKRACLEGELMARFLTHKQSARCWRRVEANARSRFWGMAFNPHKEVFRMGVTATSVMHRQINLAHKYHIVAKYPSKTGQDMWRAISCQRAQQRRIEPLHALNLWPKRVTCVSHACTSSTRETHQRNREF